MRYTVAQHSTMQYNRISAGCALKVKQLVITNMKQNKINLDSNIVRQCSSSLVAVVVEVVMVGDSGSSNCSSSSSRNNGSRPSSSNCSRRHHHRRVLT